MLLGQQLGRRHDGCLIATLYRLQCGQCRHNCFARAYIPLDQPLHRLGLPQILGDLLADSLLGAGKIEGQRIEKALLQGIFTAQRVGQMVAHRFTELAKAELVRQQLFKGQALLGRMLAFGQRR